MPHMAPIKPRPDMEYMQKKLAQFWIAYPESKPPLLDGIMQKMAPTKS